MPVDNFQTRYDELLHNEAEAGWVVESIEEPVVSEAAGQGETSATQPEAS